MTIYTKRLAIRRLDLNDYTEYAALTAHKEVASGAGFDLISNPQMIQSALKRQLKASGTLGIFRGSKLIGAILLFERVGRGGRPDPNHFEISYFLAPDCWHTGYMSEAITGLLPVLRSASEIRSLIAEVFTDNQQSLALLKRLNFRFKAELRDPIVGRRKAIFELELK